MPSYADVDVRSVREIPLRDGEAPLFTHPEWAELFPWLVQGTTGRGADEPFDLGLFGAVPVARSMERWRWLRQATRCRTAVHARQVHAATVIRHGAVPAGLFIADDADGHVTAETGVLLTVSIADCVPISVVDPDERVLAVMHAGWRGVAAGILEAGLRALLATTRAEPSGLYLHLGPAICGDCYEVGPEVHEALGLSPPPGPAHVDLRHALALRALDAGVVLERITRSQHCTRCGDSPFFSHRGGARERQVAVLGMPETRTVA